VAEDLTVLYLSASRLPERMASYARRALLVAIGSTPVISLTREPLGFGQNILQVGPWCPSTIYSEMLRGAKVAKTKFVAVAEDDTLYPKEHFALRPPADTFLYDMNRFSLFMWGEPQYNWRNRVSNSTLIAHRAMLIEALEERFQKWPNGTPERLTGELGRGMVAKNLKVTPRPLVGVFATVSTINLGHPYGTSDLERRQRKSRGPIRAYDIPHWGRADRLLEQVGA
jgi:hypothetical protein